MKQKPLLKTLFSQAAVFSGDNVFESPQAFIKATQDVIRDVMKVEGKLGMRTWCARTDDSLSREADVPELDVVESRHVRDTLHSCGTAACVLGWCATYDTFLSKGLFLDINGALCVKTGPEKLSFRYFTFGLDLAEALTHLPYEWQVALFGADEDERMRILTAIVDEPAFFDNEAEIPRFFITNVVTPDDYLEASQWLLDNFGSQL